MFRLGLASALVYLLAMARPYWLPTYYLKVEDEIYAFAAREPWRGVLFYVALSALFGFYLVAFSRAVRAKQARVGPWSVGLWTLVFCLLLIPVQPITSSDVYGYVFQGRIVAVLGENPFVHLYNEFAADPFYFCVTFHDLPATTGYGPLWIAIEAGLGWLARDRLLLNLFLFKGLAAVLHLASAFLVYATLRRWDPDHSVAGMLFYAWNPLLLHELVGNAHNDVAVAALALLGFYLFSHDRWWAALPCLTAAALVKPVTVLWLPLFAFWILAPRSQRPLFSERAGLWPRLGRVVAVAALVILPAVAAYAPFWAGAATFRGLLAQSDIHGNSLPSLLLWGLWTGWPGAGDRIVEAVKLLTIVVFVPFYLRQLWIARGEPLRASFDVMLFYLLFVGFQFMPWYLAWLMVPAALLSDPRRRRLAAALCAMALLLYFPFGWQWARDNLPVAGVALLAAGPTLGLCAWLGVRSWRTRRSR